MTAHLMAGADAVAILGAMREQGVDACVGGGWAVDALLGEQTREHSDLDLWLPAEATDRVIVGFVSLGIDRLYPWGGDRPWNWVVHDGGLRRVDFHFYEASGDGRIHYGAFDNDQYFPIEALSGSGAIDGVPVRCETAEWSVRWHSGYAPRPHDLADVRALCSRFGLPLPAGFG